MRVERRVDRGWLSYDSAVFFVSLPLVACSSGDSVAPATLTRAARGSVDDHAERGVPEEGGVTNLTINALPERQNTASA